MKQEGNLSKGSIEYSHSSKCINSQGLTSSNSFPELRNPEVCALLILIDIDVAEFLRAAGSEGHLTAC